MKNYISSTINQEIQKRMLDKQIAWNDQLSENCIYGLFEAFGVFLGKHKSKDNPVAVVLNDFNGGYHFGAFVQFIPQNEESTDEGSWALSYSFDENGIDSKNWKVFTFNDDPEVSSTFEDVVYSRYGVGFLQKEKDRNDEICDASPQALLCTIIDTVKDYMEANITIDPDLSIDGFAHLKAEAAGDNVIIGIEPSATLKQLVKEDNSIGNVEIESAVS